MRKTPLFFIAIFFLVFILYANTTIAQPIKGEDNIEESENNYVITYYFHGNFRCLTCYKIEQYTKEAIEDNFQDELDSGKLVFKVINVDEKENHHFIDDYQLYTRSVILSLLKDGKEIKYDNLVDVWLYLSDKQQFYNYIKDEISKYLEELK